MQQSSTVSFVIAGSSTVVLARANTGARSIADKVIRGNNEVASLPRVSSRSTPSLGLMTTDMLDNLFVLAKTGDKPGSIQNFTRWVSFYTS